MRRVVEVVNRLYAGQLLLFIIADDIHRAVDYSKNVDPLRSDIIDNPVWTREDLSYLLYVIFGYTASG